MHRIFLIGDGLEDYADILSSKGFKTERFKSTRAALRRLDLSSLIIVDIDHSDSLKELLKASKSIPKLVMSHEDSKRKLGPWLKEPMTYPLYEPSERDLLGLTARMLQEKTLREDYGLLRNELGLLKKEIGFFEEVNKMLTSSRDLDKTLAAIMRRVKEVTGAEAWSIFLMDERGDLSLAKVHGKSGKKAGKFRLKPGEGIAGWVAMNGVPVVVKDASNDKKFSKMARKFTHPDTRSLMCAPIKSEDRILGVMEVVNKAKGERFTEEDLRLLMKLVNQAALAVERVMLHQKMEELVITDDLTKLFNSRYLNKVIETEILRCSRYRTSVALVFMDLDFFKYVNDNYGHLVGSKVLIEAGQLVLNQLRRTDVVARYGGDEFVMVLPQTSPQGAKIIAERIRKRLERNVFLSKEGFHIKITASFGVASYPESAKTKEDLLRLADEAMYMVKHQNRNGVYAII